MGGLAGTGRSPQLHSALKSLLSGGESTETSASTIFSEEVERAEERAELGFAEERQEMRSDEHRAARHGTFGQERTPAAEDRGAEQPQQADAVPRGTERVVETATPGDNKPALNQAKGGGQVEGRAGEQSDSGTDAGAAKAKGTTQSPSGSAAAAPVAAPIAGPTPAAGNTANLATTSAVAGVKAAASSTAVPDALPTRGQTTAAGTKTPKQAPAAEPQPSAKEAAEAAEILRQIKVATAGGVRSMTVELAPLALGRVQIRVSLRGKSMNAVIEADNPETFAALEKQAPELRALLGEATGGRDVNLTLLGGEEQGQGPGKQNPDSSGRRAESRSSTTGIKAARNEHNESPAPARTAVSLTDGAIDTYA